MGSIPPVLFQKLLRPLLLGVAKDGLGGAFLHHHAPVHEDHLVGHVPGEGHLVGDDDHGGVLVGQAPDHPEDFPGELRVQGGGGLVKAEDVRLHGQGPGDGHPLLLPAGELVGVVAHPVLEAHLGQQALPLGPDGGQVLPGFLPLGHEFPGQGDVLQGGVLGEEVEVLEHQAEVEALAADLPLPLGGGVGGVEEDLVPDGDGPLVWGLQEV